MLKRLFSRSRMTRECHVRFYERPRGLTKGSTHHNKFIQIIKNLSYLVITVISLFYNSQIVIAQCNSSMLGVQDPDTRAYLAQCNSLKLDSYLISPGQFASGQSFKGGAAFCMPPGLTQQILGATENTVSGGNCPNVNWFTDCAYDKNYYFGPNCPTPPAQPALPGTIISAVNQDVYCPTGWISGTENWQYCPNLTVTQLCTTMASGILAAVEGCQSVNVNTMCANSNYQTCVNKISVRS